MSSNAKGLFVTFEGLDGSGKTTQIQRCAEALQGRGYDVVLTRNPGGTTLGQEIRQIVLHHPGDIVPLCELLLYMADRAQHTEEVVIPALAAGKIVLCDRHLDSTLAYQGYGRGLDRETIAGLNRLAVQGHPPDLTFLLDADPEILAQRVQRRGAADRLEREALDFRRKVRDGFLALAHQAPERIQVLDAGQSAEVLHQAILRGLEDRLPPVGSPAPD